MGGRCLWVDVSSLPLFTRHSAIALRVQACSLPAPPRKRAEVHDAAVVMSPIIVLGLAATTKGLYRIVYTFHTCACILNPLFCITLMNGSGSILELLLVRSCSYLRCDRDDAAGHNSQSSYVFRLYSANTNQNVRLLLDARGMSPHEQRDKLPRTLKRYRRHTSPRNAPREEDIRYPFQSSDLS